LGSIFPYKISRGTKLLYLHEYTFDSPLILEISTKSAAVLETPNLSTNFICVFNLSDSIKPRIQCTLEVKEYRDDGDGMGTR
jgi:hypothetical protein